MIDLVLLKVCGLQNPVTDLGAVSCSGAVLESEARSQVMSKVFDSQWFVPGLRSSLSAMDLHC